MRILWNSSTPVGISGYGTCTRELTTRLRDMGHFVRIATKHGYTGWHEWEGMEVFDGSYYKHNRFMLEDEDFDYIFTHWDIWVMGEERYPKEKWVGYVPVDSEKINSQLKKTVQDVGFLVALSKHGQRELTKATGRENIPYAPHGVDTSIYKPRPEGRKFFREGFGLDDDVFVIGTVGLNYVNDRKGTIPLLKAFKEFHRRHPKSMLYTHAHAGGTEKNTINYQPVVKDLNIADCTAWPQQAAYTLRRIDDTWLSEIYSGLDVMCIPTKGEGFGLPFIEAQACGLPVITTDTTTGDELVGSTGWLIDVHDDDYKWNPLGCWQPEARPSEILKCLEYAYGAWLQKNAWKKIKDKALKFGKSFDWDLIWDKYWIPIFKTLEGRLEKQDEDKDN